MLYLSNAPLNLILVPNYIRKCALYILIPKTHFAIQNVNCFCFCFVCLFVCLFCGCASQLLAFKSDPNNLSKFVLVLLEPPLHFPIDNSLNKQINMSYGYYCNVFINCDTFEKKTRNKSLRPISGYGQLKLAKV